MALRSGCPLPFLNLTGLKGALIPGSFPAIELAPGEAAGFLVPEAQPASRLAAPVLLLLASGDAPARYDVPVLAWLFTEPLNFLLQAFKGVFPGIGGCRGRDFWPRIVL